MGGCVGPRLSWSITTRWNESRLYKHFNRLSRPNVACANLVETSQVVAIMGARKPKTSHTTERFLVMISSFREKLQFYIFLDGNEF